ncbi:7-cyano-7-deazaguanine synthase QueC [Allorhodopirellula solitaria]|uniref:7-cyano-7-deazaguanine synthase n=1 Tax=Allorhodopirellula solitaria TaxID=2527987 RepID=A0A5C5WQA1_9BACT|nr:7-cyano-7-deazaguanine synthase QueC [Allorhodopirellula solitaria]TWT52271.1 7-cyano-7-deazaguanine synthase [Allorhodopirellula solitaria]
MKTIVILSGGLDSTTLLYHYKAEGHQLHALTFNYGQRHDRELKAARTICEITQTPQEVVDLTALRPLFGANALTEHKIELPTGGYAKETIGITTVPNRNMIMLSVAIGRAISLGFDAVAFGAHGGVNDVMYPDCSPEFASAMSTVGQVCDERLISVLAPFVSWEKSDIVNRGDVLAVPFEHTWSCYAGNSHPCGCCGTCIDRETAFKDCSVADPLTC